MGKVSIFVNDLIYTCRAHMRLVKNDGSVLYLNGDKTNNKSTSSRCTCGYKHYWDGREYDNLPEM